MKIVFLMVIKDPKSFLMMILLLSVKSFAIVGGVTLSDPLPKYLIESDRIQMKSHTVVLLNTQNASTHSRCTGTLIEKNIILTAAHCIPETLDNLWVVPAQFEFAVLERHAVVDKIIHESYKKFDLPKFNAPNYDLALVKFSGDLPEGYQPTTWINSFNTTADRFWLFVAGYGDSQENKGDVGEIRFSQAIIENNHLNANQSFMAGNQSFAKGICKGDSGGPAYIKKDNKFYVLGVVSAVTGACFGTSYFNQTQFYNEWIQDSLKTLVSK